MAVAGGFVPWLPLMGGNVITGWIFRLSWLPFSRLILRFLEALLRYRGRAVLQLKVVLATVASQEFSCFYRGTDLVRFSQIAMGQFFVVMPMALVVIALPIAAGWIGVGQLAFAELF